MLWLMSRVQGYCPVIEYCGGTEIGGSFLSSTLLQPNCPSMFSSPVLGSQVHRLLVESILFYCTRMCVVPRLSYLRGGVYVYVYIYVCPCVCVYVYVYVFIPI